jgi:hypothetical protein
MYLIRQHIFDFQCSSQTFGQEVQSQLGDLLEKSFYPKLEILLNQYDVSHQYWTIDQLEIEIPNLSKKYWKEELTEKMLTQIEYYLKLNQNKVEDNLDSKTSSTITSTQIQFKKWLFFYLKNGFLPANSIVNRIDELIEKIVLNELKVEELIQLFLEDEKALHRWIFSVRNQNFKSHFKVSKNESLAIEINQNLITIWEKYLKEFPFDFKRLIEVFSNLEFKSQFEELLFWSINLFQQKHTADIFKSLNVALQNFFNVPLKELQSVKFVISVSNDSFSNKNILSHPIKQFVQSWEASFVNKENEIDRDNSIVESKKRKEGLINDNVEYYINNAGVVLLHPFLERLFGLVGWTKDGNWLDFISLQKGVLSLHYLVYGDQEIDENQLVLNKILCGVELDEVINTQLELSIFEKEKCLDLLQAVLEHWHIIKDSSKEALQETFLQRDGKLQIQNSGFELWIKDHGADILLQHLPWGIGMIKTRWMEHYLISNWNQ